MRIGYIREFVQEKLEEKRNFLLNKGNCEKFFDENKDGDAQEQPLLQDLLEALEPGDVLVITKLYTLANSTKHLIEICRTLQEKQAGLHSIKDSIDTSAEDAEFFRHVEVIAELRREVIGERTKAGLQEAKQKNKTGGRPRKADRNVKRAIEMYQSKQYSIAEITIETGISKSTLYRYIDK